MTPMIRARIWHYFAPGAGTLGVFLLSVAALSSLRAADPAPGPLVPRPGTVAMVRRLQEVIRGIDPLLVQFLAADQVAHFRRIIASTPGMTNDPAARFSLGSTLLNAGYNLEALQEFEAVESLSSKAGKPPSKVSKLNTRLNEALCYLREGERINCVSNHNADSCLFPLQGGGIHQFKEPGWRSLTILTNLLEEFPDSLAARWLVNVAFMTVGEYPQAVPSRWLIPPQAFASDIPFPRFRDVAAVAGLAANELSGGCVVDDFDGDNLLDVMVTSIGLHDQMRFYRNDGNGHFTERTTEAGLTGLTGGLNLVSADYDNDGHLDVLVLRGAWMKEQGRFPNSLLRNLGDGTFEDVTEAAGMLSFHPTQTAVWFDFDGDGWLDLFVGNESSRNGPRHLCELYHNEHNGTFKEVSRLCGLALRAFVKGAVSGDINNDGRPDLYLSILGDPNRLFRTDGPRDPAQGAAGGWIFTEIAANAEVDAPVRSFPCWFFDYDNDGWIDLLAAGYSMGGSPGGVVADVAAEYLGLSNPGTKERLYRNLGNGKFADVTSSAKLGRVLLTMGSNFGDLDNDGWLDFYLGTGDPDLLTLLPNRMFRNAEGKLFQDVTTAGGFGSLQKGHAVAFADIDNDGDQDLFEDMGGAMSSDVYPNVLYENPGFGNRWMHLKLQGTQANRSAIGARVRIDFQEQGKSRSLYRTVGTGGSFGAGPLRLELGLGKASLITAVTVDWPGGAQQQKSVGYELDRAFLIREGSSQPTPIPLKRFSFPVATGRDHHHSHGP